MIQGAEQSSYHPTTHPPTQVVLVGQDLSLDNSEVRKLKKILTLPRLWRVVRFCLGCPIFIPKGLFCSWSEPQKRSRVLDEPSAGAFW